MTERLTADQPAREPSRISAVPGTSSTSAGRADAPDISNASQGARVLVVDDDRMLVRALGEILSRRLPGAEVETCSSPVDAIASIEARGHDVVVSDLLMGGLNGLELLDRVRAVRPSTMVVLITGAADRDLSVRALRGGAYDFIQKPVDADYLVASVRRALETHRLRREVERQQVALRRHAEGLEQTVALRTEELRRASRSKDEFLATLSHELRTPLTAIFGWSRLLCSGRLDAAEQAQAIESIGRNARSQAQLIDDLLDVSRIITGKLGLDVREVDLRSVLDGALGVVLPAAQAKDIEVVPAVGDVSDPIPGDPHRLQQVLWNLLSNAVKFTPPGGRIVVGVRRGLACVEITVEDNGAGIEADLLPFVFDRFRQGDSATSSRRGLGLGLAIARHLVELHGGTVTAESDGPGTGATFTVTLPCSARAPGEAPPRRRKVESAGRIGASAPNPCLRGTRVLVVDDEADTRQVLRLMLEHAGAVVETAASVGEARDAFERARPDVLLCDLGLGSEDGYALVRGLRAAARAGRGRARHRAHGVREIGGSRAGPLGRVRSAPGQARPRRSSRDHRRAPRARGEWCERMSLIRKALVVDDDEDVLRLCKVSLQTFTEWAIAVARSGDAAFDSAQAEAPDVILLDVMMPEGGGAAILGRLKGCDATAGIPVVLLTAADAGGIEACRARGAAGVIKKPFDPSTLPDQIMRIVNERSTS